MSASDEVPQEELPSALGLVVRLLVEHKTGQFVYRGQVARRQKHKYNIGGKVGLAEVENMYPSDFRFIENLNGFEPAWATNNQLLDARNSGRDRRDRFEQFILSKAVRGLADRDSRYSWLGPHFSYLREVNRADSVPS